MREILKSGDVEVGKKQIGLVLQRDIDHEVIFLNFHYIANTS